MMMKKYCFLMLLLIGACQGDVDSENERGATTLDLKETLPGLWESSSFYVTINAATGDSTYQFAVPEEEWESKLGNKPMQTAFFKQNNRYLRLYRDLQGRGLDTVKGVWNVFGDTLMLIEPTVTYQYEVKLHPNGTAEFRTFMDFDGDGQEDDFYQGRERKIKSVPVF